MGRRRRRTRPAGRYAWKEPGVTALCHPPPLPTPCAPQELYAFFGSLDTKGTNYRYEVTLTGPAVELHNCMAKLLAHPLQRPFQSHAAYSLLEGDEPPEVEATV